MFQSEFTGLKPLHRNTTYWGGFCKFWYIPVEKVVVFPRVNAVNQQLVDEPSIQLGEQWFGPIEVPKDSLGYSEDFKKTKAGHYYESKVEGVHIGDSIESRVNLENMPHHKYLVVGKARAGGFYMLIGTKDSPLEFIPTFKSGPGPSNTAMTAYTFVTQHISKGYIIPSFNADKLAPGNGSGGSNNPDMANKKEVIPFANLSLVSIPWTGSRSDKFGSFPVIEIWVDDGVNDPYLFSGGSIEADQPPPAFTELNINMGAPTSGFIVIC